MYCSLFCFCLDVQRNACIKNPKKADVEYIDLTAVTYSRSEHYLTKQQKKLLRQKINQRTKINITCLYLVGSDSASGILFDDDVDVSEFL